jgi:hypothetical protein
MREMAQKWEMGYISKTNWEMREMAKEIWEIGEMSLTNGRREMSIRTIVSLHVCGRQW